MEKVYEFLYNSDTYESAAATISIHKTIKGAEMAMEFHKAEVKKEYETSFGSESKEYQKWLKDNPFDSDKWWGIRETNLEE